MSSKTRLDNYKVLRHVGFNAESATKLKDLKLETIKELVQCARESNENVKARFDKILSKHLNVRCVFKVE